MQAPFQGEIDRRCTQTAEPPHPRTRGSGFPIPLEQIVAKRAASFIVSQSLEVRRVTWVWLPRLKAAARPTSFWAL